MQDWSLETWVGIAIGIIGILLALLTIFLANETKKEFFRLVRSYWFAAAMTILVIFIGLEIWRFRSLTRSSGTLLVVLVALALWRTRRLSQATGELEQLIEDKAKLTIQIDAEIKAKDEAISERDELSRQLDSRIEYPRYDRGRWADIRTIRYGHMKYAPFLRYGVNGEPTGLGVRWLSKLLTGVEIDKEGQERDWGDIIEGLIDGEYDVVAVPLFATFDRSKHVRFTSPLFFSNVGLYVRTGIFTAENKRDLTVDTLKKKIAEVGGMTFLSVEGEISETLAKNYAEKDSIVPKAGKVLPSSLFDEIAKNPRRAIFCESFAADYQPAVDQAKVENILPPHEIIYPVCFAVRIGDYQLADLLNIRLLQNAQNGYVFNSLAKELVDDKGMPLTVECVKKHFVAQWPCPIESEIVGQDIKDGANV